MLVTLMDDKELKSLSLPDKPAGRYWFEGFDDSGRHRRIMMFEPRDGAWVARTTPYAKVDDENAVGKADFPLAQYASYSISAYDENGTPMRASLLVEPNTDDRVEYQKYLVKGSAKLDIGRMPESDICFDRRFVSGLHATLSHEGGSWSICDQGSSNGTYVNDARIRPGESCMLSPGDVVFIVGLRIVVGAMFIALNNPDGMVSVQPRYLRDYIAQVAEPLPELEDWELEDTEEEAGTRFYRSPRFRRVVETRKITIDPPPDMPADTEMPLMQMIGPALIMGLAAMFSGLVMAYNTLNSGGSMLTAAPMLVMSVSMIAGMAIFPVIARRSQRKQRAENERTRQDRYLRYLDGVRDEIAQETSYQKEVLLENYVTSGFCLRRALNADRALWERTVEHDDFLEMRLGLGARPLDAEIEYPERHFSLTDDNLQDAMFKLSEVPTDLQEVPITLSLTENRICGIVGSRDETLRFMRNLVTQMVALHSYDEVKIVLLTGEAERDAWSYVRLLPHSWNDDQTERYFACGTTEAQEISIALEKIVAQRVAQNDGVSHEEDRPPIPYYVVIAADRATAQRCGFISTLLAGATSVGFSLVALYDRIEWLPKETSIVISLEGERARLFDKDDTTGQEFVFVPDTPISHDDVAGMSFALANTYMDVSAKRYELPSVLTFMQMYKAGRVEHLDILTRWKENDPTISLAAPIGVDENGDLFNLDLHEKNHGPHGLVAGMTGSGKSEFIITLVLSLALNYSPEEIAFVLIDYKGGGLANAFDNERIRLPHLAGTITNLDGAAINRSLVSIEAELKRRQMMFNEARSAANEGTMDIYRYQQLYRQGLVMEPLPHLLVISDEFAELKMQQPEFMDQLVSTARIGRSLGVHLILATQKPSGVVNDQIWSNAKFKVCLKVQDRADSMDMIKRPEAAELVETGRFYLQVGFNEYFAIGQSAWAGAPYVPTDRVRDERDESVVVIDDLGHVLREMRPQRKSNQAQGKQIVQIIDYICASAESAGLVARSLWLDPIPEIIYVGDLVEKYGWQKPARGVVEAVVGEYDDPARQEQNLLTVNFLEDGNLAVYGTSGGGKSMFVSSLAYSLVSSYSAVELNLFLIDFGSESLSAFVGAPQVGDVVLMGEDEKVRNLFRLLEDELAERRRLLAPFGGMFTAYARAATNPIPAIVVIIEGLAALLETYEDARDRLMRLTRECSKYGIFFVVTAEALTTVGFRMAQNFGRTLALRMNDEAEYSSVMGVGRVTLLSEAYGAGLVKIDEVLQFQTAHARSSEASDAEAIREYISDTFGDYAGPRAQSIPVLPDVVSVEYLASRKVPEKILPFGVSVATLGVVGYDPLAEPMTFVSSDDGDGLLSLVTALCDYYATSGKCSVVVLDPLTTLDGFSPEIAEALGYRQGLQAVGETIVSYARGETPLPQLCILTDVSSLLSSVDYDMKREIEGYFIRLGKQDPSFVVVERSATLGNLRYEPWMSSYLTGTGVWLGNGFNDQSIVKPASFSAEFMRPVEEGFGYVVFRGKVQYCKLLQSAKAEGQGGE